MVAAVEVICTLPFEKSMYATAEETLPATMAPLTVNADVGVLVPIPTFPVVRDTSPLALAVHRASVTLDGKRPVAKVPEVILLAFVVSMLALFARPVICAVVIAMFVQTKVSVTDDQVIVWLVAQAFGNCWDPRLFFKS